MPVFGRRVGAAKRPWRRAQAALALAAVLWTSAARAASGQKTAVETKPPVLQSIDFAGNEHFGAGELRAQMLFEFPSLMHPFRPRPGFRRNAFPNELRRVQAFYARHGFGGADVRLESIESLDRGRAVRLLVRIREGPQTLVRDIRFSSQPVFTLDELRRATPFAPGDPYPFNLALRGRATRALRLAFLARGYLVVSVRDSTLLSPDSTAAFLLYEMDPGPQFTVRAVSIPGNLQTEKALIRRELRFAPGQVYNYVHVQESQQNLYNTGLFRNVAIHEESPDSAAHTVDMAVRVVERQPAYVESSVGFGKRDKNYEARLAAAWGHRNLFGLGHSFDLRSTLAYDVSNLGSNTKNYYLEERARYTNPRLLGTRWRFSPSLGYTIDRRVEDVRIRRWQIDAQAARKSGRYTTTGLGAIASFTTTTLAHVTEDLLQTRAFSGSVTRNASDNLLDPRRGDVRSLFGQRAGFDGDNYFTRATGAYIRYLPWGKMVLAMGVRSGWVESYGKSRLGNATEIGIGGVPFEYLFQAGGSTTVRGFDDNSLGPPVTVTRRDVQSGRDTTTTTPTHAGTVLLIGNLELRSPLPWLGGWPLGMVLFLDAGNTWKDFQDFKNASFAVRYDRGYFGESDMRYGYGFGLRYRTPLGPVRVDVGLPLKRASRRHPMVHWGLGHTF